MTTTRPTRTTHPARHLAVVGPALGRPAVPRQRPWLDVRDLENQETEVVEAVFDGLSDRSRYLRFNTGHPRLAHGMLRRLAEVVPGEHVVHVAERDGEPVGLVRWIRMADAPDRAEVALEVVDSAQRQGVGRLLLDAAVRSAQRAGIAVFVAYISGENASLRRRLLELGARGVTPHPDEVHLPIATWAGTVPGR